MKKIALAVCMSLSLGSFAFGEDMAKLNDRVAAAHAVLHELMATPDKGCL